MTDEQVQLPANAVNAAGVDLAAPTRELLHDLNLLPTKKELAQAGKPWAVWGGPAQSVAVIESGITAATKIWAGGAGIVIAGVWVAVAALYDEQGSEEQRMILLGLAIITAAVVLSIGYLIASDVRGRADASVATIQGRVAVAEAMIASAQQLYEPPDDADEWKVVALPRPMPVQNGEQSGAVEEAGWKAVFYREKGEDRQFFLTKGRQHEWVDSTYVSFV
jgi:hypothetical protein